MLHIWLQMHIFKQADLPTNENDKNSRLLVNTRKDIRKILEVQ